MKKFFRTALWVIIALIFLGTFYFLYRNSQDPEVRYSTVSPSTQTIDRSTVLTGKIEPRDEIEIKPQISGIITEVTVEPGQHVAAGDVI
ncbi:MAG: efflux RND transporter periplasmic adaptor subunit, partial [Muribaculaceae bacterium]|nr:efflux RND transporter periplasmic adaptor subunit [Muribaculaceae bacterium]